MKRYVKRLARMGEGGRARSEALGRRVLRLGEEGDGLLQVEEI
jgi:hypothetical protein